MSSTLEASPNLKKLIHNCVCGGSTFTDSEKCGLPVSHCSLCGILHQKICMDETDLSNYYSEYHEKVYTHDFDHDYEVAKLRWEQYAIPAESRLLDIGSGTGAFIKYCRDRQIKAYGVDISKDAPFPQWTYQGGLKSHNFPTDYFDVITIHDSLEHMIDPLGALEEVFRILKPEGKLFLDFPNYYVKEGQHHWKAIEHIWFFTESQTARLLDNLGLSVQVRYPIPSKLLFHCVKPKQERASILVPPGIGDSYWSYVKLKSYIKQNNLGLPDVYVSSPDDKERSIGLAQRIPFINGKGYKKHSFRISEMQEAYMKDARSIFTNVQGCDHFIAFNGQLRFGKSMEEIHPELENDWYLPLFRSKEEDLFAENFSSQNGPYNLAYFVPHGMYKKWGLLFPPEKIIESLELIQEKDKKPFVLTGARWDRGSSIYEKILKNPRLDCIDLIGMTSFEELIALTRNASGIIGYPAGNTIMGTVLKRPTTLIWCNYFHEGFWRHSCPPEALDNWYKILDARGLSPRFLAETFLDNAR